MGLRDSYEHFVAVAKEFFHTESVKVHEAEIRWKADLTAEFENLHARLEKVEAQVKEHSQQIAAKA